ncbi:MAG: DUF748 domain-containing protein [Nitrospiraceae bacterium]
MSRVWRWVGGAGLALLLMVPLVATIVEEPLRAYSERQLNERVTGYQFRIGGLDLHLFRFAMDFRDITVVQTEYPDPPVAHIERWHASVDWTALLQLKLVSDQCIERPVVHITKRQAEQEYYDDVPLKEAGWQEAVLAVYPLKINEFSIDEGSLTYREREDQPPIAMTRIQFTATNIRNVRSGQDDFPSDVRMEATLFDTGHLSVNGRADFLRSPHIALRANTAMQDVELKALLPVSQARNVVITDGVLTLDGDMTYAPNQYELLVDSFLLRNLKLDIIKDKTQRIGKAKPASPITTSSSKTEATQNARPQWVLRLAEGTIEQAEIGFINRAVSPKYRLYVSDLRLGFDRWTNQRSDEMSKVVMKGRFMDEGVAEGDAAIRFAEERPDFSVRLKLVRTPLPAVNNFLRAHGGIDVAKGTFSVFTEMTVRNGRVDGYIKPLLKDVSVYDPEQDMDKGLWSKLLEQMMDVAADVLQNDRRNEVATKAAISGRIDNPKASTWEIIWKLVQNAFFEAILPGLEGQKPEKNL